MRMGRHALQLLQGPQYLESTLSYSPISVKEPTHKWTDPLRYGILVQSPS